MSIHYLLLALLHFYIVYSSFHGPETGKYFRIQQTQLKLSTVTTMEPRGWLYRAIYANTKNKPKIKDILYVPNIISLSWADDPYSFTEDEHICSLLCDQGFNVHCFQPNSLHENYAEALYEVIKWKLASATEKSVAIMTYELAIPRILSIVTQIFTYPGGINSNRLGALVLVDPPPIHSMSMTEGRKRILRRYYEPLLSAASYRRHVCPHASLELARKEWNSYNTRLQNNKPLLDLLNDLAICPPNSLPLLYSKDYEIQDKKSSSSSSSSSTTSSNQLTLMEVVGLPPTESNILAAALPNKILVLSSADVTPIPSFDELSSDAEQSWKFSKDVFGTLSLSIEESETDLEMSSIDDEETLLLSSTTSTTTVTSTTSSSTTTTTMTYQSTEDSMYSSFSDWLSCYDDNIRSADNWGLPAAEELSQRYGAGDVIRIRHFSRIPAAHSNVEEKPTKTDSKTSKSAQHRDSNDSSLTSSIKGSNGRAGIEEEEEEQEEQDAEGCWHRELADTVVDWLRLLSDVGYL